MTEQLPIKILLNFKKSVNNSIRIGITGVPGVGKSTFIEAFGNNLIKIGKKNSHFNN